MEIAIYTLIFAVVFAVGIFLVTGLMGAPYVPTLHAPLEEALTKLYPVGEKDLLIDLGAGDGVVLESASKKGAKAVGVEVNPFLVLAMKRRFRKNRRVKVLLRNFYHFKFPKETTVVYVFMIGFRIDSIYRKIEAEAKRLNKTIYFISNAFDVSIAKPEKHLGQFYLYKIDGVAQKEKI